MTGMVYIAACLVMATETSPLNRNAVGDHGRAVGPAQIWKVRVDEINRLLGHKAFTYEDRKDYAKSFQMVLAALNHEAGKRRYKSPAVLASRWRNPNRIAPEWHMKKLRKALENYRE